MIDFDQIAATYDNQPHRNERAQAAARGIRASVPLTPRITALEYGCGTGLLSFALQPYLGHITLADRSTGMLTVLDEKIAAFGFTNMAPLQLDLSTGSPPPFKVDLIYTLMTLHHIPDTVKILQSFYEMLRAPGYLCVADLDQEDGSFHGLEDRTVHKGFDRAEFENLVRQAGFHKVSFATIFQTPKVVGGETRHFPLFLMTAQKTE